MRLHSLLCCVLFVSNLAQKGLRQTDEKMKGRTEERKDVTDFIPLTTDAEGNERSSADILFRKGNAQLYLFTLNSTHFSMSSYGPDKLLACAV